MLLWKTYNGSSVLRSHPGSVKLDTMPNPTWTQGTMPKKNNLSVRKMMCTCTMSNSQHWYCTCISSSYEREKKPRNELENIVSNIFLTEFRAAYASQATSRHRGANMTTNFDNAISMTCAVPKVASFFDKELCQAGPRLLKRCQQTTKLEDYCQVSTKCRACS